MLKEVRHISAGKVVQQDWTTVRASELAERQNMYKQNISMDSADDPEHAEHAGHQHKVDKNIVQK